MLLEYLESYSNIEHFLVQRVHPQGVAILPVDLPGLINAGGNSDSVLVSLLLDSRIDGGNDHVTLLECERDPPGEC